MKLGIALGEVEAGMTLGGLWTSEFGGEITVHHF